MLGEEAKYHEPKLKKLDLLQLAMGGIREAFTKKVTSQLGLKGKHFQTCVWISSKIASTLSISGTNRVKLAVGVCCQQMVRFSDASQLHGQFSNSLSNLEKTDGDWVTERTTAG